VVTLQQGLDGYAGTEDTSIFEEFADNSSGGFPYFFAGVNQGAYARRSLLRFELQGKLPAGAQLTSASLQLYLDFGRNKPMTLRLHKMAKPWNEGNNPLVNLPTVGQGAPAQPQDSTWADRVFPTEHWATPGGEFSSSESGTGAAEMYGYWATIHGPGMAADLQTWLDSGSAANFGWALIGDESGFQNAIRFSSSEAPANQPRLLIEYQLNSGVPGWELY
jgi:hypothetical protein